MRRGQVLKWLLVGAVLAPLTMGSCRSQGGSGCSCSSKTHPTAASHGVRGSDFKASDSRLAEANRQAAEAAARRSAEREAERVQREKEAQARTRLIFDALMGTERFDLIKGGFDEWGVTVAVARKDEDGLQFWGTARLRWTAQFRDVDIEGRVNEKGHVVISGIHPVEAVVLDTVSAVGTVMGGGWAVEPWSDRRASMREEQEARAARLAELGLSAHTVCLWNSNELTERLQTIEALPARAQVLLDNGAGQPPLAWVNGDTTSGYPIENGHAASIRYANPPRVRGIAFLAQKGNAHSTAIRGVRCRINGGSLVGLPGVPFSHACFIEFEEPAELWELLIETGNGSAYIREIMLVPPAE